MNVSGSKPQVGEETMKTEEAIKLILTLLRLETNRFREPSAEQRKVLQELLKRLTGQAKKKDVDDLIARMG